MNDLTVADGSAQRTGMRRRQTIKTGMAQVFFTARIRFKCKGRPRGLVEAFLPSVLFNPRLNKDRRFGIYFLILVIVHL